MVHIFSRVSECLLGYHTCCAILASILEDTEETAVASRCGIKGVSMPRSSGVATIEALLGDSGFPNIWPHDAHLMPARGTSSPCRWQRTLVGWVYDIETGKDLYFSGT